LNRIEGERQVGEGMLFSQHPHRIAFFALSTLFHPFPGSSGCFRPRNGARMALDRRAVFGFVSAGI
jgi:hypothetical protein